MERTSGGVNNRRRNALQRLEEQLKRGTKELSSRRIKEYQLEAKRVEYPLSETDISRIEREIVSLKGDKKKRKSNKLTVKQN